MRWKLPEEPPDDASFFGGRAVVDMATTSVSKACYGSRIARKIAAAAERGDAHDAISEEIRAK